MRCPKCGGDINESLFPSPLTYCPYCGQNLEAGTGEQASKEILFCPHCGKELGGKVTFCPHCGGELARRIATREDKQATSKFAGFRARPIIKIPIPMRRQDRLYRQWTKYADLSPEDVPSGEVPRDMPAREGLNLQRLPVLYIILGLCLIILFVGFALLIVKSC